MDFIVSHDLTDIVLVGHSYGGTIISKAAEVISDRIRRLVFWNAFVLNDGESIADATPPRHRARMLQLAAASPDNTVMPPFEIWREAFINDGDVDLARWSYAQLSPEPFQQLVEPLDLRKFYTLGTPRSYLNATEDISMPPGEWGWHPRMTSRLGLYRLVQMPGSHELIFRIPTDWQTRSLKLDETRATNSADLGVMRQLQLSRRLASRWNCRVRSAGRDNL